MKKTITKKDIIQLVSESVNAILKESESYYRNELASLQPDDYGVRIVLSATNTKTKFMTLNKESIPIIIEWLQEYEQTLNH